MYSAANRVIGQFLCSNLWISSAVFSLSFAMVVFSMHVRTQGKSGLEVGRAVVFCLRALVLGYRATLSVFFVA